MTEKRPLTLGELKQTNYKSRTVKEELRENLIDALKSGKQVFEGIIGYEQTVLPQLERAILAKHNINFLGLRGQAKTRIARLLVQLLDEFIPYIQGSEIYDDPYAPITSFSKQKIEELGDSTPIAWLHRNDRFVEKLATPDVTVADLIGDIDPIKAANLKLSYADEGAIHYGLIPRSNRSIFVINELPDLQARIQVALFNILQEGDIQIRGFRHRLPLDVHFVFTANPEDYTNRGSIVTPLKDRIGSQILTHYPLDIETAKTITQQEVRDVNEAIFIPDTARTLLEQIAFEARQSDFVDVKSGVSARMSITAMENLLASVERRMLLEDAKSGSVRVGDLFSVIPAITGKVELVYEGEQEGAEYVAETLIHDAIKSTVNTLFPKIDKLEKPGKAYWYHPVVEWFREVEELELMDDADHEEYEQTINVISPLNDIVKEYLPNLKNPQEILFVKELILWALAENKKLSKKRISEGFSFIDRLKMY